LLRPRQPSQPVQPLPSEAATTEADPTESGDDAPRSGGISNALTRALKPVLPPVVTEAVMSPLIVGEALFAAMISSGQSMILPAIVLLLSVLTPGGRSRWGRWIKPVDMPGNDIED
jgi:hypothetical protein